MTERAGKIMKKKTHFKLHVVITFLYTIIVLTVFLKENDYKCSSLKISAVIKELNIRSIKNLIKIHFKEDNTIHHLDMKMPFWKKVQKGEIISIYYNFKKYPYAKIDHPFALYRLSIFLGAALILLVVLILPVYFMKFRRN